MVLAPRSSKATSKKPSIKLVLDCSKAVDDNILDAGSMEKYFHDRIKVNGKLNNLSGKVAILRERSKIIITAELPFSKRYVKYLTKKYLKRQQVRDFLRVVSTNKNSYELRYFSMNSETAET